MPLRLILLHWPNSCFLLLSPAMSPSLWEDYPTQLILPCQTRLAVPHPFPQPPSFTSLPASAVFQ